MTRRHVGGAIALLVALTLVVPMAAAAKSPPASTYHGVWLSETYCGLSDPVTGVWNVNLKNDGTAMVSVQAFAWFDSDEPPDGVIDRNWIAGWGGNWIKTDFVQQPVDPKVDVFQVKATGVVGLPLDMIFTLHVNGELTYEVVGYCDGPAEMIGVLR